MLDEVQEHLGLVARYQFDGLDRALDPVQIRQILQDELSFRTCLQGPSAVGNQLANVVRHASMLRQQLVLALQYLGLAEPLLEALLLSAHVLQRRLERGEG